MKIAVIGGTGLMGPYLLELLRHSGHALYCLNRRGSASIGEAISCDRKDPVQLKSALQAVAPDVVIDMVAFNHTDALSLCEAMQDSPNVQVIAVSSIDVYLAYARLHRKETGPYQRCPIREGDTLRASSESDPYNKVSVEALYLGKYTHVSILRMPAIYGWPDRSRIAEYLDAANSPSGEYRVHPEFAKWGFTRASAPDCASAISRAVGLTGQHIYNVGEPDLLSEEAWCREVWQSIGFTGNIVYDSKASIPFNVDLNQGWHVDTTQIRSELSYQETTSRRDIIRTTAENIRKADTGVEKEKG